MSLSLSLYIYIYIGLFILVSLLLLRKSLVSRSLLLSVSFLLERSLYLLICLVSYIIKSSTILSSYIRRSSIAYKVEVSQNTTDIDNNIQVYCSIISILLLLFQVIITRAISTRKTYEISRLVLFNTLYYYISFITFSNLVIIVV